MEMTRIQSYSDDLTFAKQKLSGVHEISEVL